MSSLHHCGNPECVDGPAAIAPCRPDPLRVSAEKGAGEPVPCAGGSPLVATETPVETWTMGAVSSLPLMLRLPHAAQLLGIGRTNAYRLAEQGRFPVPIVRIGKQYRVPTAGLLQLLGMTPPTCERGGPPPETVDFTA